MKHRRIVANKISEAKRNREELTAENPIQGQQPKKIETLKKKEKDLMIYEVLLLLRSLCISPFESCYPVVLRVLRSLSLRQCWGNQGIPRPFALRKAVRRFDCKRCNQWRIDE